METALIYSYIGQTVCTTDRGNDVAGHLKTHQGIGQSPVGRLQVSSGPVRKAQDSAWDRTPEVVIHGQEIERPPGVSYGGWHIAENLGPVGMCRCYRHRQGPKFLFVNDDHPSRRYTRVRHGFEPPFGIPQSGLAGLQLADIQ